MDMFESMLKKFHVGNGRTALSATCINTGRGVQVILCGGTSPHIGAVVMALPRPSLKKNNGISSDCYILPVPGHKDHIIADQMASALAVSLNIVAIVTAGIHSDDMTNEEIQITIDNSKMLTKIICSEFNVL